LKVGKLLIHLRFRY